MLSKEDIAGFAELLFPNISHPGKRSVLSALLTTWSITRACAAAGVSRRTHYHWLENDSEYREAFEQTKEIAGGFLQDAAIERAMNGTVRAKFDRNGKQLEWINRETGQREPYVEYVYSDKLMIQLLKAMMPERYGNHPKPARRPEAPKKPQLTPEELRKIADDLRLELDDV